MAIGVDKWVAAGIEAVKWSKLADPTNAPDMATWCSFFDFHVAALWIENNPESYQLALREGFEAISPITQADIDHVRLHIAITLEAQTDALLPRVDAKTEDRIRFILAEQLQTERKSAPMSAGTVLRWSGQAAG